ncbi:uncharacterized protein TRIADDRAFT_58090 [Trichoplax adhaerens]|uniref:Bromo domain-containing protein n=1 Tax=Trichoplax adhaerens TaxID=10228 RepID=B3S2N5_TRIAD|nr:hypothetical protein TRIADDRAFT_58090 [Trichoplax adhaerens]EDV23128.1 hypothetical protein TRIADDRAFT_58090 [Trichoplax adhaerens]|eukprot:XP_002114038.1 hypothetical protein TRIADDRAFT_58090 [Trichoplax adhaerens]
MVATRSRSSNNGRRNLLTNIINSRHSRRNKLVVNNVNQERAFLKDNADDNSVNVERPSSHRLRSLRGFMDFDDSNDNYNERNEGTLSIFTLFNPLDIAADGINDEEEYNGWLRRSSRQRRLVYNSLNLDVLTGKSEISRAVTSANYNLREKRHVPTRFSIPIGETIKRRRNHAMRPWLKHVKKDTSNRRRREKKRQLRIAGNDQDSFSSDEEWFEMRKQRSLMRSRNRFLPLNFKPEDLSNHKIIEQRLKIGSSLADIEPMAIDSTITFDDIGGLSNHINSLKEMVLFPLLYPEVFQKFNITPPRGVLFHGKPGTGKTLVARAVANQCSLGGKKVAFFMRKGADCLSKWAGESERQLRLLFDQAYGMRPAIIFFDEIDGLAPVRSSKQDQIHSSIVSTLLALMDGLDNRGEIIVIGATNRVDAIDPALRRPGRFDREFYFPLPDRKSRRSIVQIHTRQWDPPLTDESIDDIADKCIGYCGADIKALCTESALNALRRRYPQIYNSNKKLKIDVDSIHIEPCDYEFAMNSITPSAQRGVISVGRPLNKLTRLLFSSHLDKVFNFLKTKFPFGKLLNSGYDKAHSQSITGAFETIIYRPKLLLYGKSGMGQSSHIALEILHNIDEIPVYHLDIPHLYTSMKTPEESCAQVIMEASSKCPCVLFLPRIETWWSVASDSLRATICGLLCDLQPSLPILLLATSDCENFTGSLPTILRELQITKDACFHINSPDYYARYLYFKEVLENCSKGRTRKSLDTVVRSEIEILEVEDSSSVSRQLTKEEVDRLAKYESNVFRELRIFLRDVINRLMSDRKFCCFVKPVNLDEVTDYLDVVTTPMDFSTIADKIDDGSYTSAAQFVADIQIIVNNALKYNPVSDPLSKAVRHRAFMLKDTVDSIIDKELDSDFEKTCEELKESRKRRENLPVTIDESPKTDATNISSLIYVRKPPINSVRFSKRIRGIEVDESTENSCDEIQYRQSQAKAVVQNGKLNDTSETTSVGETDSHLNFNDGDNSIRNSSTVSSEITTNSCLLISNGSAGLCETDRYEQLDTIDNGVSDEELNSLISRLATSTAENTIEDIERLSVNIHGFFKSYSQVHNRCPPLTDIEQFIAHAE